MTTKAKKSITNLNLKKMICYYLGEKVQECLKILHKTIKDKLKIPMQKKLDLLMLR